MKEDILVSIVCTCFNYEKYIRSALEEFVNQKTNFRYEVIVHDDASQDKSAEIIKEFEQKYPELFLCIYQSENQYSKGVDVNKICFERARGKYIAICEGDDYWCDELKLQKQVDFLESNMDYSACACSSYIYNYVTGEKTVFNNIDKDMDLSFEDLIDWGGKNRYNTCTILYRREYMALPEEFCCKGFSDYPYAMYYALSGKVRLLKDIMGVYRTCTAGSWTEKFSNDMEFKKSHLNQVDRLLDAVDRYSDYQYRDVIEYEKKKRWYPILFQEKKFKTLIKDYKIIWKDKPFKSKVYLYLAAYFPWMINEK